MPIAADSMAVIRNVRELLTTKWQWPDIGEAAIILGFKIEHDPAAREIELIQGAYIQGLLEPFDIKDPNAVRTPEESFSLVKAELFDRDRAIAGEIRTFTEQRARYQSIMESIMRCAVSTQPDLGFDPGLLPDSMAIRPTIT
jgi:hypothetical protein